MAHQSDCVFCKIGRGEISAKKIYDDEHLYAIEDIKPAAPFHLLFIPKDHVESLLQLKDSSIMSRIFAAIQKIAKEKGQEAGFRTVINTGVEGGQTVFHLHVHMLGGKRMSHSMT